MREVIAALALKHGDIRDHGFRVEKFGKHWTLSHKDEAGEESTLQIEGHGGVAPRKTDAVLEAYRRLEAGY